MTKKKSIRDIVYLSGILFILLIIWVIGMVVTSWDVQSDWLKINYIQKVMKFKPAFVVTYMNATLLTIVVVWLFYKLKEFCRNSLIILNWVALAFVFVYGFLNIFCYFSQITILPFLIRRLFEENISVAAIDNVYRWIHMAPDSFVALLNAWAYAVLGVPSIFFGLRLTKLSSKGKYAGWLLVANAVACFLGIAGWYLNSSILQFGVVLGGFFFMLAVVFIFIAFREQSMNPDYV